MPKPKTNVVEHPFKLVEGGHPVNETLVKIIKMQLKEAEAGELQSIAGVAQKSDGSSLNYYALSIDIARIELIGNIRLLEHMLIENVSVVPGEVE